MPTHTLHLAPDPFHAIKSGAKTIESRLYDPKRQRINLGDTLIFVNREAPQAECIAAEVIGLLRYASFKDLFSNTTPSAFGGTSVASLLTQIEEFYSIEEQRQYGVLGIAFKVKR